MTPAELIVMGRTLANVDENRLPDDVAYLLLNEAKELIMNSEDVRLREETITTAFVEDTATINPAPTGGGIVVEPRAMYYVSAIDGSRVDVKQISKVEFVNKFGAPDDPTLSRDSIYFSVFGEDDDGNPTFHIGPTPNADVSPVYLDARVTYADMDADTVETKLTRKCGRALIYKMLGLACDTILEDPDRAGIWHQKYNDALQPYKDATAIARRGAKTARQMQEPS